MTDLQELLDLYDRVVAACVDVVPDDVLERAAETGRSARRRVGYLGDTIVVALAGGTGSGKSSLVNALAGDEVSAPGAQRPTTSAPLAWIPSDPEPGLTRLLDDIGIDHRVGQDDHPWLALIDLPDTDSVVIDHRQTVERLLPLVDAVVWVLDPEKYQDARLHRDQLRPLADHADRFVFALNQVDRLGSDVLGDVEADLRRSLEADGIRHPSVVLTAGDPPNGLPIGLDALVDALRSLGSTREVVERHVVDELAAAADRLVAPVGGGGGTGFSERWVPARDVTAAAVAQAVDAGLGSEAFDVAARDAAAVMSWVGGRQVTDVVAAAPTRVHPASADPIRQLIGEVASEVEHETRVSLIEVADRIGDEVAATATTVGATMTVRLPPPPAWWSAVRLLSYGLMAVTLIGLALAVDASRTDDSLTPGVVVAAGAVGLLAILRMAVRRTARERSTTAVALRRAESEAAAVAELERRLGRPLRNILRSRSAPGAAHLEFALAVRRHEERQS